MFRAIRNRMYRPWNVGLAVERAPEDLEWRLLNREHLVPFLKTSPLDCLNYYVSWSWLSREKTVSCKQTVIWHVICVCVIGQTDLLPHGEWRLLPPATLSRCRHIQVQSTGARIWYSLYHWIRRVERRVQSEIERNCGYGVPAIQVAVNSGRCHPQTQTRWRVARPEDSRS